MNYMVRCCLFSEEELDTYRQCVVFYLAVATEYPVTEIDNRPMDNITPRKIITNLKPVIRDRDVFDLNTAKETVTNFLDKNLFLTEKDIAFLTEFKHGHYRPEIIFERDVLERIKAPPMALWKTQTNRDKDPDSR